MSIQDCFKKAGKALSSKDRVAIEALIDSGQSESDAVISHLKTLDNELSAVVAEVEKQGVKASVNEVPEKKEEVLAQIQQEKKWYKSALSETTKGMDKIADKNGLVQPQQAKAWLSSQQKKGAFKQEEIEWVGLNEWLDLQEGKVAVADIQNFVDSNGVQVEEVEKGAGDSGFYTEEIDGKWGVWNKDDDFIASFQSAGEAERAIADFTAKDGGETKYGAYQLPNGENYKELLLTLPVDRTPYNEHAAAMRELELSLAEKYNVPDVSMAWDEMSTKEKEELNFYQTNFPNTEAGAFKSSHWDESNVLAHIRVNDRTDDAGNTVLFVEEVQSDFGQAKRKGENVPNAPFIGSTKGWSTLAIKRIISYAAENGYDKVAFINGEQSAERYDLSKKVDSLSWDKASDGTYDLFIQKDGVGVPGDFEGLNESKLEETIGKDVAAKIIGGEDSGELSGLDLKVGGEGMVAFYNKILPQVTSSVLKKTGGKLETISMGDLTQTGFTITDKMRSAVAAGLPLFQKEGKAAPAMKGWFDASGKQKLIKLLNASDQSTFLHEAAHFFFEMERELNGSLLGDINSWFKRNAMAVATEANSYLGKETGGLAQEGVGSTSEAAHKQAQKNAAFDPLHKDSSNLLAQTTPPVGETGSITESDVSTYLDNGTTGDKAIDAAIRRATHEQFARGFEAYLFEGKAPTQEMASAFAQFRVWLLELYKTIKALNVNLDDGIREVFDRMLASEEEIESSRSSPAYEAIFKNAKSSGMTPEEYEAYQAEREASKAKHTKTLEEKILAIIKTKVTKEWKEEMADIIADIKADLIQEDVYRAIEYFRGKITINDQRGPKLDREEVERLLGHFPKSKASKHIQPDRDSLLVAIAKLGGLNQEEAEQEGIDPSEWKGKRGRTTNQPIFGKRLFTKDGRTLDDLREGVGQYGFNFDTVDDFFVAIQNSIAGRMVYSVAFDYSNLEETEPFTLPKNLHGITKVDGVSPEEAVLNVGGFQSGHEMINAMADAEDMNTLAKRMAENIMLKKHGDILNDGSLEEAARNAAQNEEKGKVLLTELRVLTKRAGKKQTINLAMIKQEAKRIIAASRISDIQPGKYYRQEIKDAQAAQKAFDAGDNEGAMLHKTQQLANHYLFAEALRVKGNIDTQVKHLTAVGKRKYNTKQVHQDYVRYMKILSKSYNFKKGKVTEDRARKDLIDTARWIKGQMDAEGWVVPQFFDTTMLQMYEILSSDLTEVEQVEQLEKLTIPNYKTMTVEQLDGVYKMSRNLRHVGGELMKEATGEFKKNTESDAKLIYANTKNRYKRPSDPGKISAAKRLGTQLLTDQITFGNMVDDLDGKVIQGPIWEHFRKGVVKAGDYKLQLQFEVIEKMRAIFKPYSGLFTSGLRKGIVPAFHSGRRTVVKENGEKWTLSRRARIVLGMYWGSQANRDMVLLGDQATTENDINQMLATLDNKDLDLIESLWALFESLWPLSRDVNFRMTGVAPVRIPHTPYIVNGRKMSGGYMRLYYHQDSRDNFRKDQEDNVTKARTGVRLASNTAHGSRMGRVGSGGREVQLELNNVFMALDEQIHDIAFAESARDSHQYLRAAPIREAIEATWGPEYMKSLLAATTNTTVGVVENKGALSTTFRYFRHNTAIAVLGYSVRNVIQQPTALFNVFGKLGALNTLRYGMATMVLHPTKALALIEEIRGKSTFMVYRGKFINREIAETSSNIGGSIGSGIYTRFAFAFQTIADMLIAYPAWITAYKLGLKQFKGDSQSIENQAIMYADKMVSQTVGSGIIGNMSPMLQGSANVGFEGEALKTITFMGTFFNFNFNLYRDAINDAEFKRVMGVIPIPGSLKQAHEFTWALMWYSLAPAIVSKLITDWPDDDDEEDMLTWTAGAIGSWNIASVMGVRDIAYFFSDFKPSTPYTSAISQISRVGKLSKQIAEGEKELDDPEVAAKLIRGAGVMFPLAGAVQYARVLEGYADYLEGTDRNIYEIAVEGKKR